MPDLESYRRPKTEQRSEFEGVDYLHSPRSEHEFRKDLDTLLREYLRAPSVYEAYLTAEGDLVDHAGNKLTDMVDEAVKKRIGQKGYERTWAESAGVFAMQALYWSSTENDLIVLASPPGLFVEGFGKEGERMSMTGISLITPLADGRKKITTYTVPIPEISPEDHVSILKKVVDQETFETVMGNDYGDHPDRHLVSRPIRIINGRGKHKEDDLLKELGYLDFQDLKKRVEGALKLENDAEAEGRRVGLTSFIAKQIVSYRDKKDEDGLRISGKVIKMMYALEASGEYVGWDLWKTIQEFKDLVNGFRVKERVGTNSVRSREDTVSLRKLEELYGRILQNSNARLLLSASSCGSSGAWQDMFNNDWRDMNDFGKQNIVQDILESKDETYSFDHEGKCVVCKIDPKKLGPCQICEDCDHKIRAQVE